MARLPARLRACWVVEDPVDELADPPSAPNTFPVARIPARLRACWVVEDPVDKFLRLLTFSLSVRAERSKQENYNFEGVHIENYIYILYIVLYYLLLY